MVSVVLLQTSIKLNLLYLPSVTFIAASVSSTWGRLCSIILRFLSTRSHHRCRTRFLVVGENVKEFFFRVASLAFETSVLSELEKGGSKQIGDVVRKYLLCADTHGNKTIRSVLAAGHQDHSVCFSGINSNSKNLYTTTKKKQSNCCQWRRDGGREIKRYGLKMRDFPRWKNKAAAFSLVTSWGGRMEEVFSWNRKKKIFPLWEVDCWRMSKFDSQTPWKKFLYCDHSCLKCYQSGVFTCFAVFPLLRIMC